MISCIFFLLFALLNRKICSKTELDPFFEQFDEIRILIADLAGDFVNFMRGFFEQVERLLHPDPVDVVA